MSNNIFCKKLNEESEALDYQPIPGKVGQRIQADISAKAWDMWIAHQTMLINEYRLNLLDVKAQSFLSEEMEKFLFGSGSEKPSGFSPIDAA